MSLSVIRNFISRKSIKQRDKTTRVSESGTAVTIKEEMKQNKHEIFDNDMICRVCTNPADILIDGRLYPDSTTIMSAIRTVANITIKETDYYPKYICTPCLEDLKTAYHFKRRCEASDMMFRKAIPSETLISTQSRLMVSHDFSLILHEMKQRRLKAQTNSEQSNIHEFDTKYEVPWNDGINNDENLAESSNSSDNEVISLLLNKYKKEIKETESKKKDTKMPKLKVRLKRKKKDRTGSIQSRIAKLLEFPHKKDMTKRKLKIKKEPKKKKLKVKKLPECKPCGLKFDTREKYEAHRRKNNCIYHPCSLCGKLVMNLSMHEKIVHLRSDKYTCDQCGKVYYSSSALCNHLNVHKNTMEYSCDLCPYRAKRKSYLVCHMRVHTGERQYLCSQCPANFSNLSNLRKHQGVHNNKMFECSKCKKTFRQKTALKTHFDSAHLNIRYRCSICGKDLCSRKKLLNHELKVHKREKHKLFHNEQKVIISNDKEDAMLRIQE